MKLILTLYISKNFKLYNYQLFFKVWRISPKKLKNFNIIFINIVLNVLILVTFLLISEIICSYLLMFTLIVNIKKGVNSPYFSKYKDSIERIFIKMYSLREYLILWLFSLKKFRCWKWLKNQFIEFIIEFLDQKIRG